MWWCLLSRSTRYVLYRFVLYRSILFLCFFPAPANKGISQHSVAAVWQRWQRLCWVVTQHSRLTKQTINASHGVVGFQIESLQFSYHWEGDLQEAGLLWQVATSGIVNNKNVFDPTESWTFAFLMQHARHINMLKMVIPLSCVFAAAF